MTTEEKARKYDEAIDRMKHLVIVPKNEKALQVLKETIFPELAENEDWKIRQWLVDYFKEVGKSWIHRDITCEQILAWLEKQKENPKSCDSIPSDCTSDAKCEDRWYKVKDSLPNSAREVLCKDAIGNFFIGRYYKSTQSWEVVMYDDCDKDNEDNPPVVKWCEIPSEKQKEPDCLEKFIRLPHLNSDYEVVDDWAYTPSLAHCDGSWGVCWVHCEEGDTLHECIGDTPAEAIDKAVEWFTSLEKPIRAKEVGAIISSRDKEETACGYLERCLTPDMRKVWYEACDELKKACFQEAEKQKEQKPVESRKRNKPKESWLSNAKYEIEHADELLMQRQKELKEIRELKQKEQESESCEPDTNVEKVIEDVIRVYGKTQGEWVGGYDVDTLIVNLRRAFNKQEQKPSSRFLPADWVVYDGPLGHAILQVKDVVDGRYTFVDNDSTILVEDSDEFLRPLTPKDVEKKEGWKPQPESLEALMYAIEGKWDAISPTSYLSRRLEDLYEGLVNTYNVDESLLAEMPKAASRAYTAEDIEELRELKRKIEASMEQKSAEKQDYSGLNDLERAIHRGFLSAGVENVPVTIIKETAKECLAQMKPAEWDEEDKERVKQLIYDTEHIRAEYEERKKELGENFNDNLIKDCDEQIDWLKSLPERFNLQPKEEWSEEDEEIIYSLRSFLIQAQQSGGYGSIQIAQIEKCLNWLKSLPLNLKKKNEDVAKLCSNEWSDEDKAIVGCIAVCLDGQFVTEAARKQCLEWFNRHRRDFLNRPSWKPSEEQMDAFEDAMTYIPEFYKPKSTLASLLRDLKKLK